MGGQESEEAIFAAGCFWGVQFYFDQVPGVIETEVGYTGGKTESPTYETVCSHTTGHAEAVRITFDPEKISYGVLVKHFFRMHDPTQLNRQGSDVGDNYRSAIFYTDEQQRKVVEQIKQTVAAQFKKPIVTEVTAAQAFYRAEEYHQKYTEKTGIGMCHVPYEPLV